MGNFLYIIFLLKYYLVLLLMSGIVDKCYIQIGGAGDRKYRIVVFNN